MGSAYRSSQAYSLQLTALAALPRLATDLKLEDEALADAMTCVQPYLSKKQPKALQVRIMFLLILIVWAVRSSNSGNGCTIPSIFSF